MHQSEIKFNITLDETKMPEKITWNATDSGIEGDKEAKAIMVSVWDKKEPGTLRIDLWTKEMMVDEMEHFTYQTLRSMCDTLMRSTNNKELTDELRKFSDEFGKKIKK